MAIQGLCQACGKAEAAVACEKCGKALCEACGKTVHHQELGPASQTLGSQLHQLGCGEQILYYCADCFSSIDVYEQPRGW